MEIKKDWKTEFFQILRSKASVTVFAILILLVALRLGVNWFLHQNQKALLPRVKTVIPVVKTLDTTLNLPGNIEAIEQASLYAHVSGYLKKIYVDEGDRVEKGQLLAEIDAPDVIQEYHKEKAEFGLKEVTRKRYDQLLKEKVISQQEFDTIDAEANESKARLDNASANMEYTHIRAPFSGSIARRYKYPGDLISTATHGGNQSPIFMIVNEDRLRISTNVPQIEVAHMQVGHPV